MKGITSKNKLTTGLMLSAFLTACAPQKNQQAGSIQADSESNGIVGGSIVHSVEVISQVTVQILDLQRGSSCTGSILAENLILTAAHCTNINPQNLLIIFSSKIPNSAEELKKMNYRRVVAGKAGRQWSKLKRDQNTDWGDIAILKFNGGLPAGYKVANLLTQGTQLRNGQSVTLAGFGVVNNDVLKDEKGSPLLDETGREMKGTPSDHLRKVIVRISDVKFSQTEILMDQTQGRGACHGDSGGPAFVNTKSGLAVIGVTSRGENDPNDTCLNYSVYTSVPAHIEWIKATATELNSPNYKPTIIPQPLG